MSAGKRDIEIVRGDDYAHVVNLETPSGPIDITGRTYTAMLRKNPMQAVPDATFLAVVSDGPNGEITITLGHLATAALKVGCYRWDLQQDTGGIITTILKGEAKVVTDVTR